MRTAAVAKGIFLELRAIPVLLWSFTAIVLGTGVAVAEAGRFDPWLFVEALLIGVLIQGYETHAVNEIYDWRSGTDGDLSPRVLSGGSRVLLAGLLNPAPPVQTSYRPFAGDWLGGFTGVTAAGLGAYYVQALTISVTAVLFAVAHACVCVGMLLMHHYLDMDADSRARPQKRTTIVFLGPRIGKVYATSFAIAVVGVGAPPPRLWGGWRAPFWPPGGSSGLPPPPARPRAM